MRCQRIGVLVLVWAFFLILAGAPTGHAEKNPFVNLDIPGLSTVVITTETPTADGTAPSTTSSQAPAGQSQTAAGAAAATTPTPTSRYTVVRGDCLWNIAKRFLGDGSRFWEIVELNKSRYPSIAKNPDLIHPGWEFIIPGSAGESTPPGSTPGTRPPSTATPVQPPTVTPPAAGASGARALLGWLQAGGLSGENLRMAWSIAMAESGGNPRAFNGNTRTGDQSYGLFQINMLGSMGPARRRQFGISSNDQLFDPMTNIRAMLMVSGNCQNWRPWSVYKNGSYTRFYANYPPR